MIRTVNNHAEKEGRHMVILLSPVKRMRTDNNDIAYQGLPRFLDEAESLRDWLRGLTREELRKLWKCNDTMAGTV